MSFNQFWSSLSRPNTWFTNYSDLNDDASATIEEDAMNAANNAAQEAQQASDKEAAATAAAAAAEAEKLRQRKWTKATILTDTDQALMGTAPTGKAALLG